MPFQRGFPLRVEVLEDRLVFAGNVTAQVVAGQLLVTGDDSANGLTLEKIVSPGAGGGPIVRLTPDATTSINNQSPGTPLDLTDVTGDGRVNLRASADTLTIIGSPGLSFVRSLAIDSGTGADFIKMQDVLVSSLSISSSQGDDQIDLSRTTVGGGGGGGGGSGGSVTGGLARIRCSDGTCAVSLTDSTFSNGLSVVSKSGGLNLSSQRCAFFDVFLDIDSRTASPPSSSTSLDECLVGGSLRVSTRGGGQTFSMTDSRCVDMFLKYEGVSSSQKSSSTIDNCTIDGALTVDSRGAEDLTLTDTRSSDIHIKYRPIKAELLLCSTTISGGENGSLTISGTGAHTLNADSTSFSSVSCDITTKTGTTQDCAATFDDVSIDGSLRLNVRGNMTASLSDCSAASVSLSLERLDAAAQNSKVSIKDFSFTNRLSVQSRGGLDLTMSGAQAAVDMFLKLDGIKGESTRSTATLTDCPLGNADIRSSAPLDLSAQACSFFDVFTDVSVASDASQRSSMTLDACTVSGTLRVNSRGGYDVKTNNGSRAVDMFLKFDKLSATAPNCTTSISDSTVTGRLEVASHGGYNLAVSNSRCSDMFLKIEGIKGESVRSSTDLSSCQVDNIDLSCTVPQDFHAQSCTFSDVVTDFSVASGSKDRSSISLADVDMDGLQDTARCGLDITMSACSAVDMFLKLDKLSATDPNSTATIGDCTVTGRLQVNSSGGYDLALNNSRCSDMYLKIEGIKGELLHSSCAVTGGSNGDVEIHSKGPLDFTASSTSFFDVFTEVAVGTLPQGASNLSKTGFTGVDCRDGIHVSSSGGSQDCFVVNSHTSAFDLSLDCPGSSSSDVSLSNLRADNSVSVVTRGAHDVTVDRCAAVDMFLKFERLSKGQLSDSSCSVSNGDLSGTLTVRSRGALDVTVDSCSATSLYMKIEGLQGETKRSHVTLTSTDCDDQLTVLSNTPTDFSGEQLSAADFYMKIESLRSSSGQDSTVSLRDSSITSSLSVSCAGGADRVTLDGVSVDDRVSVSTGSGNDVCVISRCDLGGSALFDGGTGTDSITATDSIFSSSLVLFGWEQVGGQLPPTP